MGKCLVNSAVSSAPAACSRNLMWRDMNALFPTNCAQRVVLRAHLDKARVASSLSLLFKLTNDSRTPILTIRIEPLQAMASGNTRSVTWLKGSLGPVWQMIMKRWSQPRTSMTVTLQRWTGPPPRTYSAHGMRSSDNGLPDFGVHSVGTWMGLA